MAESELSALTATQAAAEIARGALTAEGYVAACLARIAAEEERVGAFAHLDPEHAMAQARHRDAQQRAGETLGPLHGIPVAIKDIIDTADYPTEYGSKLTAGRRPARDATIVARLRAAGAVIVGKTVTTEFAFYHPGPTRNPHDPSRTPGGSSSGSAAAVAARMVPLAVGTQTNGSLIRPGSFCGVHVCKPSHGLLPRTGVLTQSQKLDHPGPFARTLDDLELLLGVMAGADEADPDTLGKIRPAFGETNAGGSGPVRFAFVRSPVWDRADPSTQQAFERFAARLGDRCEPFDLPDDYAAAWQAHRDIMAAGVAHELGPIVDRGGEDASAVLRDLVAEGRRVPATRYLEALDVARRLTRGLDPVFARYDAIITPATRGVAPKGLDATGDPVFCTLWTLTGLPALSLPLLTGEGDMPLGVQLVGRAGGDAQLLHDARYLVEAMA